MKTIEVTIPYKPREQFIPFHERKERWAVMVVHRRAGKTVSAINELIKSALTSTKPSPRFAYVAPTYAQAKDVAWNYLKQFTHGIPDRVVAESELHITLAGDRRVRLYGADNYDRMRGIYLDGCVIDEPADMDPQAWFDVIRPALSDRTGWCCWIGTPKGKDAFYRLWRDATASKDWYTMRLSALDSGLLPKEELESAKQSMKANMGAFEREYECSFEAPIAGAIYGEVLAGLRGKGRVREFEWNRSYPVFSSWDIGWNDNTSVWLWQICGPEIYWIWHTRQKGKTAAEMANILQLSKIPIQIHYLPHDGANTTAAMGLSYRAALLAAGLQDVRVVPQSRNIWDGINYLRDIMNRSWFRLPDCAQGLEALEAYHTKDVSAGSIISREPVHDWSSHDSDAARTAAEALMLGLARSGMSKRIVRDILDKPTDAPWDVASIRNAHKPQSAMSGFHL